LDGYNKLYALGEAVPEDAARAVPGER
jgi:hypothetical protein